MKKILLFISIVFFALYSNKTTAQIIDSLVVNKYIECPGDQGIIDVYLSNLNNSSYSIVLQKMDANGQFQSNLQAQWFLSTQVSFHQFTGLNSGFYRVLLVDTNCATEPYPTFPLPPDTCIYDSQIMPLNDPLVMTLSAIDDTLDCWYDTNASLTVDVSGYTQSYFLRLEDDLGNIISGPVSLGPSGTSYTFTNLSSGDYNIFGTDTFSCPEVSIPWEIIAPDTIIPGIITIDSISCFDADDGELTINPIGGTQPPALTIDWYNVATGLVVGTGNSTNDTLPPGQYYALITDDNGCDTISDTITLFNPLQLLATTTQVNPICNGDTGFITIIIDSILQGKGGPFTYTPNGVAPWPNFNPFPTIKTLPPLPAGLYTNIKVRDVNLCEYDLPTVTLIEPLLLEFSIDYLSFNGTDPFGKPYAVSCNGFCDAEITIDSVWGGNLPPYGNSSSYYGPTGGVIFVDTLIGSDTCAGNYSYLVTDSLGCKGNGSITINEPPVFSISADTVLLANGYSVSCPGTCDGLITINPSGGAGDTINYFVSSSNSFQSDISFVTFNNVCGENTNNGQDTIIAIDANGCIDTTNISLLEPVLFTYDIDSTNENCSLNNGTAWISNIIGGLPPYTYTWAGPLGTGPFSNNDTIENLSYGQYNVTVTDAMGCFFFDSTFVDSSFILVDPINVLVPCNGIDNGEITINTNGVLLSQIRLENLTNGNVIVDYDSPYNPPFPAQGGVLVQNPNIATVMTFANLTSSLYELRVELYANPQGSQGCASKSYYITIGDSVSMDATLDVAQSQLDLACFGDVTDSIFIHVLETFGNGNSPNLNAFTTYSVNPIGIGNVAISDAGDANFLQSGGLLPAGNYDIVITPALSAFSNCFDTVFVTVTEPDSMQFTLGSVQTLCYGDSTGSIFVDTIFGGNSGQYNYTWRNTNGATLINPGQYTDSVSGLPAGWYYLSVLDSLNCSPITIDSIEVTSPDDITWVAVINAIDSCGTTNAVGEIEVTSFGGMGVHAYEWNGLNAGGLPYPLVFSNINGALVSGMHNLIITDTNGCTKTDSVFIENGEDPALDPSSINNVSCFGLNDGSYYALVDSINGSLSFPYEFWNYDAIPPGFDSAYIPSADSLVAGDTILIKLGDSFGCQTELMHIITEPALLEITYLDTLTYLGGYNVSCNGNLDGELTVHVIGGTLNYSYWLQDTNSVTFPLSIDSVFSGLASTYYKVFVIDDHGCLDSLDIYLDEPDSLLIDSFNIHTYIGGNNISCTGFTDGAAQVNVSGGNTIYSYLWSNGSVTDTAINLNAVSYSVTVTDPNGCFAIDSIFLTQPTQLIINGFNTTNLLCKGGDRGSASVNISGSTPGYTYFWDNANVTIPTYINPNDTVPSMNDTTAFADTLRAGWYNVGVWDTNGCYITDSVELIEPIISITIDSLIITQMTCFTYDNASVDIIATGPQPTPYLYSVYDESNPANILQGNIGFTPGLSSGNYVALVEDNLGCLDRDTFIINPLDSVYIDTVVFNNVSCNGFNDGYIQNIVPMGGTAPYEYSINGGPHFSSWLCNTNPNTCPTGYIFSGLAAGIYDVEIWDANGCANSYKITIDEPVQMAVSITTNSYNNYQILCNGEMDSAVVNVSGGLSPYTLDYGSVLLTNNSGSFNPSGISAGIYIFTITDNNSCTYMETVTFNEPDLITFSSIITDVFCDGLCTGEITAIVSGGVGLGNGSNYTYQWYEDAGATIPILGKTSYNIDGLCTGSYTIEATDANGCTGLLTDSIGADVLKINITNSMITNLNCFEDCDGSIYVDVTGGIPASSGSAYTYLWNDILAQTNETAIGLCQGLLYNCTVTDMAGCVVTNSIPFIVTQPDEFDASIVLSSSIECNGGTGDLSITTTGGSNPVASYEWSDGITTTNSLSSVIAGNYTCFVEDNNGCTDTAHYNLVEPSILTVLGSDIITSDVKCKGGNTGQIHITASGGIPIPGIPGKWKYILFDMNDVEIDVLIDSTAQFTGLSTGSYYVVVTDDNGCPYTTGNIFIGEPDNELEITIDSYDETCLLNDAYAVVYPIGGTPVYSFDWDNNGASSNAQQILLAGENTPHTVIVTDGNGCEVSETITLLGYKNVFLPNNNDYYNTSICLGETINIDIDDKTGLTYVWTMSNGAVVATIADLTLMSDSSFSPIEILTLTITDPDCGGSHSIVATVNIDDLDPQCSADKLTILLDQSVTLSEIGPVNFGTYEWTNTNGELLSNISSFTYTPEKSDWYNLYVTNGVCKGYCSIYITLGVLPVDAISPNGDGYNDTWYIQDLERYPDAIVKVFNRWGQLLLESDGPSFSSNDFDWTELPVGTYYYIIDLGNGDLPQTGPITIIK